jgi:uncharacterized protein YggE
MKTLACSLLTLLVLCGIGSAQVSTTPAAIQLNTIYAGADGKFEAAPDTAVIHMDVASQQDTSRAAYDHAAAAVDRVRQVLKSNGIDVKNAQFGMYQMQPIYDWKNPKHKVIGYRVVTNVTLKLKLTDAAKVGPITEQLADIEDTQNQSVNYTLEDIEQAKSKASEDALRKAREQAGAVATAGGRTLGELLYASVDVNQANIIPVMAFSARSAAPMAAPPPMADFTPQTVTINAHVNALFALK